MKNDIHASRTAAGRSPLAGAAIAASTAFLIGAVGIVMALATLSVEGNGLPPALTLGGLALWLILSIATAILIAGQTSRQREARLSIEDGSFSAPRSR